MPGHSSTLTRVLRTALVAIVSFALGVTAQRYYDAYWAPARARPATPGPLQTTAPSIDFEREPLWAYGFETIRKTGEIAEPQAPPTRALRPNEDPNEQTRMRTLAGSSATYSVIDVRDGSNVIDWFPGDHPTPMPGVIKHGPAASGDRRRGCGSCHLPNGQGRPENAPAGGLPVAYFVRQIEDFRNGLRRTADPRKPNTNTMIDLAKAMTGEEIEQASRYFGAIKYRSWIRVVETDRVPRTRIAGNLFLPVAEEKTEPINGRIIEVPENEEQTEKFRNPHVGFVAYVPPGSIEKGKDLVTTGGMRIVDNKIIQGKTTPCVTCHGLDLMGVVDVPPIAGRSPSYIVRQLWDIQQGARNGASVQLMKMAIAQLSADDLLAVAAYVSSRPIPHTASGTLLTQSGPVTNPGGR
jgi:cytochrome c553